MNTRTSQSDLNVQHTYQPLDRDATIYVAGHRGMAGSAIWRKLERQGFTHPIGWSSSEVDLRHRDVVFSLFREHRPRYVVLAAARVGGIMANSSYPVEFLSDNIQIQTNVMDAALRYGTERLLFLASSCIYPRMSPQPISENQIFGGPLEPTNDAYAIAKLAGIVGVQAVRRQYGLPWISAMPTNLYGPGDNFSESTSHVLPALIRRYVDAVQDGDHVVTNWGTGTPRREFLHCDDFADACLFLLDHYDDATQVNVGVGNDSTIRDIAGLVAESAGFHGRTEWDGSKPDGMPQKLLDVSMLANMGWVAETSLPSGIAATVEWYRGHRDEVRT